MSATDREIERLREEIAELKTRQSGRPLLGVAKRRRVKTAGRSVGQWWSPPWLAAELAQWAGLAAPAPAGRRWRVLDAGAGRGALSLAALEHDVDVTMVERDARLAAKLEQTVVAHYPERSRVRCGDYLAPLGHQQALFSHELMRGFDVVLSNPPWEGDLPERFIDRALGAAGRVCAIVPLNMLCGGARASFWRSVQLTRVRALPHRPRFAGARGGMRDVMLIEVRPATGSSRQPTIEVGS